MAKQKVVLKLSMEDAKKRAKAMKCAVGLHGVVSATYEGDKITVVGEGIDPVVLTAMLRKKMGSVELETVTGVEEKKEEKKEVKVEAEAKSSQPFVWPYYYYGQPAITVNQPPYYMDVANNYDENNCSIM